MNKRTKKITFLIGILFVFFICIVFSFLPINKVFALEVRYPSIYGLPAINNQSTLPDFVKYFFNIGIALACLIALLVITYGGIKYLLDYGRGKFASDAKDIIKSGILGLLIIVCSYVIMFTINPQLVGLKLNQLPDIIAKLIGDSVGNSFLNTITFKEIPIGKLAEEALTKKIYCYAYDPAGNPIDGEIMKTDDNKDSVTPTYLEHDIIDCISLLADASQKKGKVVATLSTEINKLMDKCVCTTATCQSPCNQGGKGCDIYKGACPAPNAKGECTGACATKTNPFETKCIQKAGTSDCCPVGVKDQIEHGPIQVGCGCQTDDNMESGYCSGTCVNGACSNKMANCQTTKPTKPGFCSGLCNKNNCVVPVNCGCEDEAKKLRGLDEFRCPIQQTAQNRNNKCAPMFSVCINIASAVEKEITINKKTIKIIDREKWDCLNLLQQLTYYKEKINEIKSKVQASANALIAGADEISKSKCYMAAPYVDVLKQFEKTDQKLALVFPQRSTTPESTTYCKGFNYANSSCFKKCNDACPDDSMQALSLYRTCQNGTKEEKEACIERAYGQRACPNSNNAYKDWNECISTCRNDCSNFCAKKYSVCSEEFKICQDRCAGDTQCLIDNAGSCLFGAEGFVGCAVKTRDAGNAKYCIENAYTCKNGSNQNAGYPECNISGTPLSGTNNIPGNNNNLVCQNAIPNGLGYCAPPSFCLNNQCIKNANGGVNAKVCQTTDKNKIGYCNGKCNNFECQCDCKNGSFSPGCCNGGGVVGGGGVGVGGGINSQTSSCSPYLYSASYVYDNPECLKCQTASAPPKEGSICYDKTKPIEKCQTLCPETTKCSPSSACPSCKCDEIENTYTFKISDTVSVEQKISAHQIVGPECNSTGYNDDPLTFFCQNNWWTDPNREGISPVPIGQERVCTKDSEIPVGRMIDDTLNWVANIGSITDSVKTGIDNMVTLMKKAGNAKDDPVIKDYCKCNAKMETRKPVCNTDCKYGQVQIDVPVLGADGKPILNANGKPITKKEWVCSCSFLACNGKPCQQIIDYLSQMENLYTQLRLAYINLFLTFLQEPRSDILKELTYSRQKTNSCSVTYANYEKRTRMLNCTRVEDELITPVNSDSININGKTVDGYCYGQKLGNVLGTTLNDNWFCCEEWTSDPTKKNNP